MDERELHLILMHFPVILAAMAFFSSLLAIATKSRTAWIYASAAFAWWKLTRSKEAVIARWMQVALIFACAMGASTVGRAAWLGGKVIREQEALKTPPKGWVAPPKLEHEH